jgi:hypothetical protein
MIDPVNVILGMPGYGRQTSAAGRGFWRAMRDQRALANAYLSGSLLASNFNHLWCIALNHVHSGKPLQYFAMLHDDIGPEDFWLDKLIAELEAKKLDVLSVVVPIKDPRGITSIALQDEDDNWRPAARLSMHDIYQLPETFTAEDVGAPLLLNTGCWVCRWDQDWCKQMHFEVKDRIVFHTALDRYEPQCESEDWYFSRECNELGLRLGATRIVKLDHTGDFPFTNERPWGTDPFDKSTIARSPLPNAFPYDVRGWLHPDEGAVLGELARGKRVLEIGSYCGLSTVCLARTAARVTAVDYFDGRNTPQPGDTWPEFAAAMERHGVAAKVDVCHPDSDPPLAEYDLVFIDGAHDAASVRRDIAKACAVIAPAGLIAFHDYRSGIDPGVDVAVDEFLGTGARLISHTKTLAVVQPAAGIPLEV